MCGPADPFKAMENCYDEICITDTWITWIPLSAYYIGSTTPTVIGNACNFLAKFKSTPGVNWQAVVPANFSAARLVEYLVPVFNHSLGRFLRELNQQVDEFTTKTNTVTTGQQYKGVIFFETDGRKFVSFLKGADCFGINVIHLIYVAGYGTFISMAERDEIITNLEQNPAATLVESENEFMHDILRRMLPTLNKTDRDRIINKTYINPATGTTTTAARRQRSIATNITYGLKFVTGSPITQSFGAVPAAPRQIRIEAMKPVRVPVAAFAGEPDVRAIASYLLDNTDEHLTDLSGERARGWNVIFRGCAGILAETVAARRMECDEHLPRAVDKAACVARARVALLLHSRLLRKLRGAWDAISSNPTTTTGTMVDSGPPLCQLGTEAVCDILNVLPVIEVALMADLCTLAAMYALADVTPEKIREAVVGASSSAARAIIALAIGPGPPTNFAGPAGPITSTALMKVGVAVGPGSIRNLTVRYTDGRATGSMLMLVRVIADYPILFGDMHTMIAFFGILKKREDAIGRYVVCDDGRNVVQCNVLDEAEAAGALLALLFPTILEKSNRKEIASILQGTFVASTAGADADECACAMAISEYFKTERDKMQLRLDSTQTAPGRSLSAP